MRIHIVTLHPEYFATPLATSIPGRAVRAGVAEFRCLNPRLFAHDRYGTVDDAPYGGGAGMVLKPEPLVEAVESITGPGNPRQVPVVLLTPQGRRFDQATAERYASLPELVFVCGRYKGVDERVRELVVTEELSVGDYVLSGGEPACMVVLDAIVRLLPGALGDEDSAASDSFGDVRDGGLDCAWYTRPVEFRGKRVPEVLLSGHHAAIESWRRAEALERTRVRRPELVRGGEAPSRPARRPPRRPGTTEGSSPRAGGTPGTH